MHLAELAEKYGFVIVEDDPYWALRFAGEQLPSIASWSDNVISLGTFSKLVVPGLRVGYAVAPTWAREHLAKVKQGADLHTSSWGQVLLSALVSERGWLSDHIEALVRVYGTRAKALEDSLVARVGERFAFTRPDGGMFLWGRLTDGRSATDLLPKAVEQGMAFVPGEPFYSGPPDVVDAAHELRDRVTRRARRRRPPLRRRPQRLTVATEAARARVPLASKRFSTACRRRGR